MKLLTKTLLLTAAATLMIAGTANADPITATFLLTSDHCTGGCLTGQTSGGTITVTQNSVGSLTFNVTLSNGNMFVDTGFEADFGFNLAGNPTISYSSVSSTFTPVANPETAGSLHMDGTGFFEYGLLCTSCGSGGSNPVAGPLTFTITGTGLTLASLEQNALGQYFAVDMISGTTGKTGAVDASLAPVPDGGFTMTLLGSSLLALAMFGRKFGGI